MSWEEGCKCKQLPPKLDRKHGYDTGNELQRLRANPLFARCPGRTRNNLHKAVIDKLTRGRAH